METISIDKECIISISKELTGNIKDNFVDGHIEVQIIKNPSLYIKTGDFVHLDDTYYGIIKSCEFPLSRYNRTCTVLCYVDVRRNQYFGPNSNIICNELRLATDEEKESIISVMRANGHDWNGWQVINYIPERNECKYGVKFESGEFVACQKSEAEAFKLFVTEKAAEIYADKLNEAMRRI